MKITSWERPEDINNGKTVESVPEEIQVKQGARVLREAGRSPFSTHTFAMQGTVERKGRPL